MRTVFADTFFYLALLSREDRQREHVERVADALSANVVTTAWVLTEVANSLAEPPSRELYPRLAHRLSADPSVEVIPASDDLFRRGEELYAERPDKGWSLTDCISSVVMRDRGITEALTADHHFEQAGFAALLK